jgi:hypothetical protein
MDSPPVAFADVVINSYVKRFSLTNRNTVQQLRSIAWPLLLHRTNVFHVICRKQMNILGYILGNRSILDIPSMDVVKGATKGLIAFIPEIDRDKTTMGLPPVTSAVFLIAK